MTCLVKKKIKAETMPEKTGEMNQAMTTVVKPLR